MMSFEPNTHSLEYEPGLSLQRPDIFSRGALDLTFRLLRHNQPSLALQVRNLLAAEVVPLNDRERYAPAGDHFLITLAPQQVGSVVNALTQLGQDALQDNHGDTGRLIVLRTLIKEWMTLAEWIILNAEQDSLQRD